MIIKRVDLKKLKINGAECVFDRAELIISSEDILRDKSVDSIFEFNINIRKAKSHINFSELWNLHLKVVLDFETADGQVFNANGFISCLSFDGERYEELGISMEDWAVVSW